MTDESTNTPVEETTATDAPATDAAANTCESCKEAGKDACDCTPKDEVAPEGEAATTEEVAA